MEQSVKELVREMTLASDQERLPFPEIVRSLMEAGVERYYADMLTSTRIYYLADGSWESVQCQQYPNPAMSFSAAGIEQAIRASQSQEIRYREFCKRIAQAGCVGYFVSLAGKRAVYFGRSCDMHVEWFPGAKPEN